MDDNDYPDRGRKLCPRTIYRTSSYSKLVRIAHHTCRKCVLQAISNHDPYLPSNHFPLQAISVWSNCSLPADATAMIFSDDESTGEDDAPHHPRGHLAAGPRGTRTRTIAYRNSLRLSRKWVHTGAGKTRFGPAPQFVAIATSPCGHMIATAYTDKDEIMVWMRRSNVPPRGGKPWEMRASLSGEGREKRSSGEGSWNFQPATVLPHSGPLVQLVWGRDPGSQQDYLLTLGEDGRWGSDSAFPYDGISMYTYVCRDYYLVVYTAMRTVINRVCF